MNLSTAAGTVQCDKEFVYANDDIGEVIPALVLPDTPTCLSMGIHCVEHGWHFEWPPHSHNPVAWKPDGTRVDFKVRDYVAYVADPETSAVAAATTAHSTTDAGRRRENAESDGYDGNGGNCVCQRRCCVHLLTAQNLS